MTTEDRQVTFTVKLSDADIQTLQQAAGLTSSAKTEQFLSAAAKAATEMLTDELLGRAEYPTKTAARQTRLLKLVQHAFANQMPATGVVAALFHLTPSSATALIAATAARYAPELRAARTAAAKAALLGTAQVVAWDDNPVNFKYQFACTDTGAVAYMKELLAASTDAVTSVTRSRDTANVYDIDGAALRHLAAQWSVDVADFVHPTNRGTWDTKVQKAAKGAKGTP